MSRYRKIEVSMWADSKFLALSPLPPSGQSLWIYLLTGPHTGPIPGLFRLGPMALAEELGWGSEDFAKAFREVFGEGLDGAYREGMAKADTKARVMALPKAILHNLPQSPNVVLSWAEEWKSIPECWLKNEAKQQIRSALATVGESYVAVFDKISGSGSPGGPSSKASRKASRKASGKASGKASFKTMANQEQEQEQDIKDISTNVDIRPHAVAIGPAPAAVVALKSVKPPCPHEAIRDLYHDILPELRQCRTLTEARKGYLRQRWRDGIGPDLAKWRQYFTYVRDSDFLMGRKAGSSGRPPFEADLEWLVKPANFAKVVEGKFHEIRRHG